MPSLDTFDHLKFVTVAKVTLKEIRHHFGHLAVMKGRDGAYFCASDADGTPFHTVGVGSIRREKRRKYHSFSEEKGARLALLNKHASHALSRESADDDLELYIGGVRVADGGYQISGFPGDIDECGSIAVAHAMGELDTETAHHLLKSNPHYSAGMDLVLQVGQLFGK